MRAPELIETTRLVLRRPVAGDARAIFERYAGDQDVTRYVAWPKHSSVEDSVLFIDFSEVAWNTSPGGPYVVESRLTGLVLGGAGFSFEETGMASVGYVFAKDAWGQGYATEALLALVVVARQMGVSNLSACCHPAHNATIRVLEKCGFVAETDCMSRAVFPNIASGEPTDVLRYTLKVAISDTAPGVREKPNSVSVGLD